MEMSVALLFYVLPIPVLSSQMFILNIPENYWEFSDIPGDALLRRSMHCLHVFLAFTHINIEK